MTSHRTTHHVRRLIAIVAAGLALAMAPMPSLALTAQAEAPASSVTGLARGARGEAVRAVQEALIAQGITVAGGVDGVFGPGTESAVKAFQSRHGLSPSGKVDLATAIALGLESSDLLGLAQGNRGSDVKTLQQKLAAAGHTPNGGVDGIFGPGTAQALKNFQQAQGFSPTGIVNAATAAVLMSIDASAEPSPSETPTPEPSALAGLKIGSRGELVERVQNALMDAGFTVVGGADGIYGALTANAVKSFQNANGLALTGEVDDATAQLLELVDGSTGDDEHDPSVSSPFVGLQYGSLGSDVKALQQALIDAGIHVRGGADGVFGVATRTAVKEFQANHALSETGKVDEATANALASRNPAGSTSALVGLKAGALGNTVQQLQQAMIDAGITVRGGADGIFGPATAQALKQFQTSQGLESTGIVDAETAEALDDPQPIPSPDDEDDEPDTELGYAEYGEKGSRVRALQQALVDAGITVRGGVDGDFGGATSSAVMEFQGQNSLKVTGTVNASTAEALGLEPAPAPEDPDASGVELEYFPVQGKCYYGDSWLYARGGGRYHLGVDIIANQGNLLYAVADGKIDKIYTDYPGSLAGNGVRLRMADGTYGLGVPVTAGQVLGTVGNTGNSGTPHLHFEVHPQGGSAVNPYPLVKAIDACSVTEPLGLG
jgi:peptidoglycan hydrolase-like protein with peptidoglycan-binding domain